MSSKVQKAFRDVRRFVAGRFPSLSRIRLFYGCPLTEYDHRMSTRQYMHVFHVPGMVCCSKAADKLPPKYLYGIFLHEFGHLIMPGSELDADEAILNNFNLVIQYTGHKELQEIAEA